ncbi:sugar transferase [Pseudooceanicola nanhaiensis]|uniref:sugar transferase n=1 Tax=Pseudooceanicola nanhaiensis TaxID=375761 RepID=UPI001CD67565|nr:sugar transferase [Pseudooceanicola nanhaiensis]MCA0921698.1 sugar transferase [Pseudooceanicola nanhaiensis]
MSVEDYHLTAFEAKRPFGMLRPVPTSGQARSRKLDPKRLTDVVLSAAALLFFAPFLLGVALVIWIADGRPILFAHERVGLNGKPFKCLKFRTMVRDADARLAKLLEEDEVIRQEWLTQRKLTKDPRLHVLGNFLRKSSLDELPQLINVLRGDMSIVGPRPVVAEEARFYGDHFEAYKSVRPGLTGAWQVSGRSNTSYAERVDLDVDYVENRTFVGDLRIMAKTAIIVLFQVGAR